MRYILLAIVGSLAAIFLAPQAAKAGIWLKEKWVEINEPPPEPLEDEPEKVELDEQ